VHPLAPPVLYWPLPQVWGVTVPVGHAYPAGQLPLQEDEPWLPLEP
jgi:hypothetical protein